MHTHSQKLWLGRLFALVPIALSAGGCFNAVVGEAEICFEEDGGDDGYAEGEKFKRGGQICVCNKGGKLDCSGSDSDGGAYSDAGIGSSDAEAPCKKDEETGWCIPDSYPGDAGGFYEDGGWSKDSGWFDEDGGYYGDSGAYQDAGTPDWDDAAVPSTDAGWGGYCVYEGKPYQIGENVPTGKTCDKCHCVMSGVLVCESAGCMTPSGCYLGETLFPGGQVVTCADGCNTCTCGSKTDTSNWFSTKIACPALPAIAACPASIGTSAFPAQLVYREGDALAVVDSRCVNGQTLDYGLCWEGDLSKGVAELYVFSNGTQRACNATVNQRVFSLLPLRQALVSALPNQPDIKAGLKGSDSWLNYTFRAP